MVQSCFPHPPACLGICFYSSPLRRPFLSNHVFSLHPIWRKFSLYCLPGGDKISCICYFHGIKQTLRLLLWTRLAQEGCCCYHLVAKLCLTLCGPMDYSPPGYSVHGISQARILEWLPFPSPGDHPDSRIKTVSPALAGKFFIAEPSGKPIQLKPSGRANVSSRNISGPLMNEDILSQAQIPLVNLSETTLSFENFRRMIFHCHQWRRPTLALLHIWLPQLG